MLRAIPALLTYEPSMHGQACIAVSLFANLIWRCSRLVKKCWQICRKQLRIVTADGCQTQRIIERGMASLCDCYFDETLATVIGRHTYRPLRIIQDVGSQWLIGY